ncbi:MAG: hypothetical protein ABW003_06300 [Microvirga sp.]
MKKLLIATSAIACLMGAPLAAQAATASQNPSSSYTEPHVQKHTTVRHHTAKHASKSEANRREASMKHKANCPAGSQSAACQPTTTGSTKKMD